MGKSGIKDEPTGLTTSITGLKAWTRITFAVVVKQATIEVPFTMTLKSRATGHKVESRGTYKGINTWDAQPRTKEEDTRYKVGDYLQN